MLPNVNVLLVKVNVPDIVRFAPNVKLTNNELIVQAEQTAPLAVVQVPVPDKVSNVTVSADVGAEAPPAPPVVADQLVVVVASHVPEPPTQNLLATIIHSVL